MRHALLPFFACALVATSACSSANQTPDTITPNGSGGSGAGGAGGSGGSGGTSGGAGSGGGSNTACALVGGETRITNAGGQSRTPSAVWDSTREAFLVVFTDDRSGNADVYAAWIGSDGQKKGDEWPLAQTPDVSHAPSVAKQGNGFLVAYYDETPLGSAVKTLVLGADGQPAGNPIQFSPSGKSANDGGPRPQVAPAFGGVSAAWMDLATGVPDSLFSAVSQAGTPQGAPITLGQQGTETDYPALAANDQLLAVVYSDKRDGHLNMRAALYDNLSMLKKDLVVRNATGDANNPKVAWDGQKFVVAWEDLRTGVEQVYAAAVSPDGTATTPTLVHDEGTDGANWPSLAASGTGTAIAYYQFRTGAPQIFVSFLGSDGNRVPGDLQVSNTTSTAKARFPSIAWDGNEYGVAWEDTRSGNAAIYFAIVSCP